MKSNGLIMALPAPPSRALIACQIQSGSDWVDRTYEVRRAPDGWLIDFGEGAPAKRVDWDAVLIWLSSLRPRDVEMLAHD